MIGTLFSGGGGGGGGGAMSLINWEEALRDETKTAARDTRVSFTGEGTH